MSLFKRLQFAADTPDANLVTHSLGGNRDAFCEIVTRYQTLLCSLAYSSVGDLKHSEDIAQEAFVEAWKKLDTLHDPEKLKAWLCGILRFKVSRYFRSEKHQATNKAAELDEEAANDTIGPELEQDAIDEQQQAILWQTLDAIDATYREPLILFYREQQSVKQVAEQLELSPETAKQRLSRGRKLLTQAVTELVEKGLRDSKPNPAFTLGVMSAVSQISPPSKLLAAGAAKGGLLLNLTTALAFLASFSGLISSFFGLRASLDQSRTERERKLAIKSAALFIGFAIIFVGGVLALKYITLANPANADVYTALSQFIVIGFIASYLILVPRMFNAVRTLRMQERIFHPEAFEHASDKDANQREYKSRLTLLGVPLIHFKLGALEANDKPAFGWIAGGNYAHGLLFAWGGVAVAPISVGIISYGIVTIGGVGIGLVSLSAAAIGVIAFGASAIGYKAYASLSAMGWESAFSNGFSIANDAAIGYIAYGEQINNELAGLIINLNSLNISLPWLLASISALVIIPSVWYARKVRKHLRE